MPEEPPSESRFENADFIEIAVDGKVIARVEVLPELAMSPVEDAVVGSVLRESAEQYEEEFQSEHDMSLEEAVAEADPEVEIYDSDEWDWGPVDLTR